MIRVAFTAGPSGRATGLALEGHAGLAAAGQDVLCAAVSVLAENLGASLERIVGAPVQIEKGEGRYRLTLAEEAANPATDLLFASALLGLKSIARQFPERVELAPPGGLEQ